MGNEKQAGHTCSSKARKTHRDGTSCLAPSPKPGSLGLQAPTKEDLAAAKAADALERANRILPKSDEESRKTITKGIQHIIDSPFYKTADGKSIVALVKHLNASGDIIYEKLSIGDEETEERASWDGDTMRLDIGFADRPLATAVELVHEGTHVLWSKNHKKGRKSVTEENIDDEYNAQKNQLTMFGYMSALGMNDLLLDRRLEQLRNNELRNAIAARMKAKAPK